MVDDCTVMPRSSGGDHVRFCGANDRDYEIFSAAAEGLGIEVRERTDELPHLCLQGPNSRAILQGMTTSDLSSEAFPYYTFREDVEVAGIPVFMTRLGYTAELGYELWVDRDRALDLWDALLEQGAGHGMEVIGMDALDLFRIEGGFIIGGVEYDPTVSPYECGLGWAVDLEKPGFQGRDALRDAEQTSTLRLTSVALEAGGAEATGAELSVDGAVVGFITQAVVSPYLEGKTLGLAKVDRNRNRAGHRGRSSGGRRRPCPEPSSAIRPMTRSGGGSRVRAGGHCQSFQRTTISLCRPGSGRAAASASTAWRAAREGRPQVWIVTVSFARRQVPLTSPSSSTAPGHTRDVQSALR